MNISKEELEEIKKYPLNKRIRMIRISLCLSQREFAERMNLASNSVSIWESGKRKPKLETMYKIIRTFDLPMDLFNDIIRERIDAE